MRREPTGSGGTPARLSPGTDLRAPPDLPAALGLGRLEGFERFEHKALGTWNALLLAPLGPGREDETLRAAVSALRLLDRLEDELSRFRSESEVCLLNALGSIQEVPVSRALFEVLTLAKAAWEETGGAFDPTVGRLMDAWGFPGGPGRVPPEEEIDALLEARGMGHVLLEEEGKHAWFDRAGVSIDLGAVGKGYCADRVVALLRERGIPAGAFVSGTSTVVMWGEPPGGGPWTVAVTHPERTEEAAAVLEVEPGSVSTSGAYQDRFILEGVEYGHILDPRTGRPARTAVRSVTVWAPQAVQGDMLSTALFVLGGEEGERLFAGPLASRGARASAFLLEERAGSAGGDPAATGRLEERELHVGEPGLRRAGGRLRPTPAEDTMGGSIRDGSTRDNHERMHGSEGVHHAVRASGNEQ